MEIVYLTGKGSRMNILMFLRDLVLRVSVIVQAEYEIMGFQQMILYVTFISNIRNRNTLARQRSLVLEEK